MNNRLAISGLDSPSRASRAILALGGQLRAPGRGGALAGSLAGRPAVLAPGPLGEPGRAHRLEHVVGSAYLLARVGALAPPAQPFAVQQVGTGQLQAELGAAEPVDRLAVQAVGGLAVAQQRPGARLDAQSDVLPRVVSASWSRASPAMCVFPLRAAASISSGRTHAETYKCLSSLAWRAAASASS